MNNADRDAKGRHVALVGSNHPRSILVEKDVSEIKDLLRSGRFTLSGIGLKYGVSLDCIWQIKKEKQWRHVK